jgi:hypothetical protein
MKRIKNIINFILSKKNIVWSVKGILLSLIFPHQNYPKKTNFLFYCHDVHRHSVKEGKFYAPLVDPIIEEISKDENCICLASPFSKIYGKSSFGDVKIDNFSIFIAYLKRFFLNWNLELAQPQKDPLIKAYKKLLRKINPSKVIGIQPSIELCIAAKELNIISFDIQHGIISDVNYYNLKKRISVNQKGWPDYVLCWDESSAKRLNRITKGMAKSIVIGNPAYHSEYGINIRKNLNSTSSKKFSKRIRILVSLTYLDYGFYHHDECYREIGIPSELVTLIKNTSDIDWNLRLHPVQVKFNFKRANLFLERLFLNKKNVDWHYPSFNSLNNVLTNCFGHITVESATALDAAQNCVPTIMLGCPGITNKEKIELNFLEYIEEGIIKYLESEEICKESLDFFTEYSLNFNQTSNNSFEKGASNFKNFISRLKNNEI